MKEKSEAVFWLFPGGSTAGHFMRFALRDKEAE
jgi:hypothetical protein